MWQFISSWWDHHLEQNPFGGNIWPNWERPAHKELAYINNWTSIKVKFWWQCFVFRIASLFIDLEKGNDLNLSPTHCTLFGKKRRWLFFCVWLAVDYEDLTKRLPFCHLDQNMEVETSCDIYHCVFRFRIHGFFVCLFALLVRMDEGFMACLHC